MPTIDGQAVGDGFTFLLESDNFFRSLRRPLRIDVAPGLKDDQRFKEFVAICGKRRYTALVPVSGADWDGIRQCPVSLQYSPEAGFRHTVPIPGSRRPIELAWCPFARPLLGSPPEEPGRDADESFRSPFLNGFWMATTEVTQGQWKTLMGSSLDDQTKRALEDPTEYPFSDRAQTIREYLGTTANTKTSERRGDEDDDVPIYFVSWQEAMEFCRRLTAAERAAGRLPEGFAYALPTENQWEYACRAGSTTTLPDGTPLSILGAHNAPALDPVAWYGGNSSVDFSGRGWDTGEWREKQYPGGYAAPRRVAGKRANAWGIYDMLGNVCEWCFDELGYKSAVDAFRGRALRGGAWNSEARFVRPAERSWHYAGWRSSNIGFRVALVAESQNPFSWNRFAEIAGTTQK
jgi:formylglycine-generating enzyme required for sulfatase activity